MKAELIVNCSRAETNLDIDETSSQSHLIMKATHNLPLFGKSARINPYNLTAIRKIQVKSHASTETDNNNEENDGGKEAMKNALDAIYGKNYTSQPGYAAHFIKAVQDKMAANVVGGSWTSLGPTYTPYPELDSGRVRSILPHPTLHNVLYVLTSGGGLWKTTNFNATNPTWIPLTDFLTTTSGGSAALGSNPDTIYMGLGDPFDNVGIGGLFTKSIDGGKSWSAPVDLSVYSTYYTQQGSRVKQIFTLVVDTTTTITTGSDIILISTNLGIFRSNNGGVTFTNPYVRSGSYLFSLALTSNHNSEAGRIFQWIGYDWSTRKLLISSDTGLTWNTPVESNWDTITTGNAGRTTFAVGAPGEAVVYALAMKVSDYSTLDVFKSTNGDLQTDLDVLGGQGWYNHMLLVDPSDSTRNTVYAGGQLVSVKTTNGGSSWSIISTWYGPDYFKLPYVHADFHAAAAYTTSSTGVTTLIFGTDGGLFASTNSGSTWTSEKNRGLVTQLPNFICGSPLLNRLMIGLQDQGTRERTDSTSTTWYFVAGGDGDGCGYSQALNKVNIMSYYYNQFLCRYYDSNNGGFGSIYECSNGITESNERLFFTNLVTPSPKANPSGTTFFTVTAMRVYRSSMPSGSITWTKIGTVGSNGISSGYFEENLQAIGIGPTSINQVAVAKSNGLCITTNGGGTWVTVVISNSITGWTSSTSPVWASSTMLYLGSSSTSIGAIRFIKSINTGSTWIAPYTGSTNNLPDVPISKLVVSNTDSSGNTVIAATWIGVYITTDGGVNWNVLGSKLPNVVVTDIYEDVVGITISAYGRGVWSLPHAGLPTRPPTTTSPSKTPSIYTSAPSTSTPSGRPSASPSLKPVRCNVLHPEWIGDHYCDNNSQGYNTEDCDWDGGDCCPATCGEYSTCGSALYPFACLDPLYKNCIVPNPTWVGDHYCDGATPGDYNTAACNWDGGDCCEQSCGGYSSCGTSSYPYLCLDPNYFISYSPTKAPATVPTMSPVFESPESVPTKSPVFESPGSVPTKAPTLCDVPTPSWVGDHYCDSTGGYNTAACNWDGGDCCEQSCGGYSSCGTSSYPYLCLDPNYFISYSPTKSPVIESPVTVPTKSPTLCNVTNPSWVGDHYCDGATPGDYNTAACNYDGGDCCEQTCGGYSSCGTSSYPYLCLDPNYIISYSPTKAPVPKPSPSPTTVPSKSPTLCNVPNSLWVGDHICDGATPGDYNTAACNYDGGDCCEQTCGGYRTCGTTEYPYLCLDPSIVTSTTSKPTSRPSISLKPSRKPTRKPSTKAITKSPSKSPINTRKPSRRPSRNPRKKPTVVPSQTPTLNPTSKPSEKPSTGKPSQKPTTTPK
eukprot:gene6613-13390_t